MRNRTPVTSPLYTNEEWWVRSEMPDDPSSLPFGLPEVWLGFMDEDGTVWGRRDEA